MRARSERPKLGQKGLSKNNQFTEQRVRQSLKTHLIGPEAQTPSLLVAAEVVALVEVVELDELVELVEPVKPVELVELMEPAAVAVQELEPFQTEKNALPTSGRGFLRKTETDKMGQLTFIVLNILTGASPMLFVTFQRLISFRRKYWPV